MVYNELAERVGYFKNDEEGLRTMSRVTEQLRNEGLEEGIKVGRSEGLKAGRKEGLREGEDNLALLLSRLMGQGRNDDVAAAVNDKQARDRLYKEFGIV